MASELLQEGCGRLIEYAVSQGCGAGQSRSIVARKISINDVEVGDWRITVENITASGMSTGTAETPQEAQGQRPASPAPQSGETPNA